MKNLPKIAITMGEPGGIGPEIIVRALYREDVKRCCFPLVVGDYAVMETAVKLTGLPLSLVKILELNKFIWKEGRIPIIEPIELEGFPKGKPSKESGKVVYAYLENAIHNAIKREVDAIVTAPISKESFRLAGLPWPGHTELLAAQTDTKDYAMMFIGGPLKVILVTIHMALKDVPTHVTMKTVLKTIRLADKAARMLGISNPKIGVAGLNPHAGEGGIFGNEEMKEIIPAIEAAKKEAIPVSGPYPPDVIFHKAYQGEFSIVCAMYHDQGLVPLKMIAFETGINLTIGLPIIRTSPDHGTAFDIAWKGVANPSSLIEAIKLASVLQAKVI